MAIITVTPILSNGSKLNPTTISFDDTRLVNLRDSAGLVKNPPGALTEVTFRNATNPGQNTVAFVAESLAAIQAQTSGGALSPLQPLPLAAVATFGALPAAANDGDIIFVTDASGDPLVTVGGAQYTRVAGAWVISGREVAVTADGQVATIAARDALVPVIGQTTNVVDASGDPAITAGEATYIWDGNSWITIDPNTAGLVYVADATIAIRDARTPANGDFSYVADASADPAIAVGPAFYQRVNGAWVLQLNNRYNDYAVYATIAARDADAAVLDGDVAFVTDASADPAITAGSAYYVRVNGLWVLQLNASGLSYVAYATIAARDAATVIDGDFAEVTDASADPNVDVGTAFYQRRSGAWVRIEGRSFEYVTDATIVARDARVNVENGDVAFVADASADPDVVSGSATYIRSNGAWVRQVGLRFNDYASYATIALRDADANAVDGDVAFVADASADVDVAAGAATYDRVNGLWVRRYNNRFNNYAAYADITVRDADLDVRNGDVAFVSDASLDADVDSGSAAYVRIAGAWVRRIDEHAFNVVRTTNLSTTAGAAVLDLATFPVANNEQISVSFLSSATSIAFTAASPLTGTSPGDERHLKFRNTASVPIAIDTTNFPAYLNGSAFPNPVNLALGATLDIFMKHTDQLRPYASSADVVTSAGGISFTSVADIAARDALVPSAGDIANVADPTADFFFDLVGAQKYRFNGLTWAPLFEDVNGGGNGTQSLSDATVGVNVFDLSTLSLIGSEGGIDLSFTATTALSFSNSLSFLSTVPGSNPLRRITLLNNSATPMSLDMTNFPVRMDGQSYGVGLIVPAGGVLQFVLTLSTVLLNTWVVVQSTLLAASSGLAYTTVADIVARDALVPNNGDFAFVTSATADPNVNSGSATYQRINGAWVQEHDGKALSVERSITFGIVATGGADTPALTNFKMDQFEHVNYNITGTSGGSLTFSSIPGGGTIGDVRLLTFENNTASTVTLDFSLWAALGATYIDGSPIPSSTPLLAGASANIHLRVNAGIFGGPVLKVEHTSFDVNTTGTMIFTTVANIAARNALTATDGDVVQVTDASTEADVPATGVIDARYRRVGAAWERIHEKIPNLSGEGAGIAIPITTVGAAIFSLASVDFVKNVWTNIQLNAASTLAFTGLISDAAGGPSDAGAFRFFRIDNIGVADFFIDYTNFPTRLDGEAFKTSERMLSGTSKDFIFWRIAPGQPWRTISGGNKPTPKLYAGLYLPLTPNVAPFSDLSLTGGVLDTGTLARTATSVRLLANRVYKIDYIPRMDDAAGGYVDIALRNITTATDMIDARFPTVNYGVSGLVASGLSMIFDTAVTGDVQVGVRVNGILGMGDGLIDVLGGSFIVTEL